MGNLAKDLEFWMTNLPEKLKQVSVIHLAIPGSHDSTTYAINSNSNISPDARNPLQYLKFLEPIIRPTMIKWSKTQSVSITDQLKNGIRYFDLRIALKEDSQDFYFVHNLYSDSVLEILQEINEFLDFHSGEIVILDCQHFYDLALSDHKRFVALLNNIFGTKLLPYSGCMTNLSLDFMTRKHSYQILLIYRCDFSIVEDVLWPGVCYPTPWPDTVDISKLVDFLNLEIKDRDFSLGFVSQCVLTPTVWYALKNFFGSLKTKCVLPLEDEKYQWLQAQKPGKGGLNVVISDFIEYQDYQFCKEVVNLNKKLLQD